MTSIVSLWHYCFKNNLQYIYAGSQNLNERTLNKPWAYPHDKKDTFSSMPADLRHVFYS